ncbi:radical SAM protein [Hymenobacter weizhouensis]|uniref:radical SAM protein n=1 Tax=Hymenobacter sp. YIM 151500-1 TaxID=2987689 RepID=UPI002227F124|nr:radical SAM protein [Hymenobacter sp. YIM 151500-1]UYZ63438.1 radical SAM protein [Hymenobacter sp. YIM 151500-1]
MLPTFLLMLDPKITLYAMLNKALLDRLFYVPFWDCPYECSFCCVDSRPGAAPGWPDAGEEALFALAQEMSCRYGRPVQLHFYGGEPMLRAGYVEHVARRVRESPFISKLVLYTTLRSGSPRQVLNILGPKRLEILVNPDTVNERVTAALRELRGVARLNLLPVHFVTGRGAVELRPDQYRWLPVGWPGHSCFARTSGPLVNGPQGTVHVCCLPQSPLLGSFDDAPALLLDRYDAALRTVPRALNRACRAEGLVHPCAVCNRYTGYQSQAGPSHNAFSVEKALSLKN